MRQGCLDHRNELAQNWANAQALKPLSRIPEPTMIKLVAIEPKDDTHLLLRFTDGAWGIYDFSRYLEAGTEMTLPLRDPQFFARCFIEAGALAWPNGFDLSAEALYLRLREAKALNKGAAAA